MNSNLENYEFIHLMNSMLTKQEFDLFYYKWVLGYSHRELIAIGLNGSRVSKLKERIVRKYLTYSRGEKNITEHTRFQNLHIHNLVHLKVDLRIKK